METSNIFIAQLDLYPKGITLRNCVIAGSGPEIDRIKHSTDEVFHISDIYKGDYDVVLKDPIKLAAYCKAEHNSFTFSEIVNFIDAKDIWYVMLWDPILGWLTFDLSEEPVSNVMEAISQRYWELFNLLCNYYKDSYAVTIHDSVKQSLDCIIKAIPLDVRHQCRKALELAVDNFICAHHLSTKLNQQYLKAIKSNICRGDWLHGVQHKRMRTKIFTHVAVSVTNIQWDTSDDDSDSSFGTPELPVSVDIRLPIILEAYDTAQQFINELPTPFNISEKITDFLSDTYGFCVEDFDWEGTTVSSGREFVTYAWDRVIH